MDMSQAEKMLSEALPAFDFGGELVGAVRYGSGRINDTFVVHTQPGEDPCRRFILQRISSAAFKPRRRSWPTSSASPPTSAA